MEIIKQSLKNLYSEKLYTVITFFTTLIIGGIYYYLLVDSAGSIESLFKANNALYNWAQILSSILNAIFSGIAVAMIVKIFRDEKKASKKESIQTFIAILFSTAVTGCYVCGAVLLPTVGIGLSLLALPFGGLEIKLFTTIVLAYSIYEYAKPLSGMCKINNQKFLQIKNGQVKINKSASFFKQFNFIIISAVFIIMIVVLPLLPESLKLDFRSDASHNGYICESQNN